jgi:uncharacterized membrane protein
MALGHFGLVAVLSSYPTMAKQTWSDKLDMVFHFGVVQHLVYQ